jgi:hypothetical protein
MNKNRLNKEYELDINDFFDIRYGSVNRLNPMVIYVSCKSWIRPLKDINFKQPINMFMNSFKQKLKKKIINSTLFDNKLIYDDCINYNTMQLNKKNYFSFEFYIKRNECETELKYLNNDIESLIKELINELSIHLKNDNFILTKNKKGE